MRKVDIQIEEKNSFCENENKICKWMNFRIVYFRISLQCLLASPHRIHMCHVFDDKSIVLRKKLVYTFLFSLRWIHIWLHRIFERDHWFFRWALSQFTKKRSLLLFSRNLELNPVKHKSSWLMLRIRIQENNRKKYKICVHVSKVLLTLNFRYFRCFSTHSTKWHIDMNWLSTHKIVKLKLEKDGKQTMKRSVKVITKLFEFLAN